MTNVDKRLRIRCRAGQQNEVYGRPTIPSNPMRILHETGGVIFPYTPTITYKQNPQWQSQEITHSIQQYYYFTAIESAQIGITGAFTVQNSREGEYLLAVWHFLRSYSKMYFGNKDPKRGLPPPVLRLDGYGDYVFQELPVIIQSWNMEFPSDIDYVKINTGAIRTNNVTSSGPDDGSRPQRPRTVSADATGYAYLPAKTNININLVVQRPPNELKNDFNLRDFREGRLLKGFT